MNTVVSVIIPTYNGKHKVANLLDSLATQTYDNFEIIVSIDGSSDDTFEYLNTRISAFKNLIVLNEPNGGRAVCRNRGAIKAKGELLLFLDDDMRASADLIEKHVRKHAQFPNAIVVGSTFEDPKFTLTDIQKYKAYLSIKWSNVSDEKLTSPYISAANFSIPKNIFTQLGMFDEKLNDAEDYDLAITAFENNIPIYFDTTLLGWHDDFITCEKYIYRQREYAFAQARLVKLKPERYLVKYPFRNKTKLGFMKRLVYSFFASIFWVKMIDANYLKYLPLFLKYKIYDFVITGLAVHFEHRKAKA